MAPVIGKVSEWFLRESVVHKNKETVPGQTLYADFEFAVFFDWRVIVMRNFEQL